MKTLLLLLVLLTCPLALRAFTPPVGETGTGALRYRGAKLVLAEQGRAFATIVTADAPAPAAAEAAQALQAVVARMTGVTLPVASERAFRGRSAALLVGDSALARRKGVRVSQDYLQGDRYVVRTVDGGLALVGNDARELRGSAYAVYDLLQRLGCGWYGPDPAWQVIPRASRLAVGPLRVSERPAFDSRAIWMVADRTLQDAWRLGGRQIVHGHALARVVPRELYAKEHPEYFGPEQPCLTNPAVAKIAADGFRAVLEREKRFTTFSLCTEDTGGFCECAACKAAGNYSARLLGFANAVSRELARTHPGQYLLTFYAYWYTHAPPDRPVKAEPGVCVMQVNEGNHVQPWAKPELPEVARLGRNNTRETTAFAGWRKTGAQLAIYEWWIPGCSNPDWRRVPWYSGETALQNLRTWRRGGVRYLSYETQYEDGTGFPLRWPLYYVGARGMWNPKVTAREAMAGACRTLFGPAAVPMQAYYRVIEEAMARATAAGGNWSLPAPDLIYTPGDEAQATAALDAAAAAAATADPAIRTRIAQERALWDAARAILARLRAGKG